jgi:hypothetical protein
VSNTLTTFAANSTADFTPQRFLIDTNILIDVSRGNRSAIDYVDELGDSWAISPEVATNRRVLIALPCRAAQ